MVGGSKLEDDLLEKCKNKQMIFRNSLKLAGKQLFESSIFWRKKSTIVSRFALDYAAYLHFRLELTNITLFLYFLHCQK